VKYYFQVFGSVSVLFIEYKHETGSATECLDAIAQVITECDGLTITFSHYLSNCIQVIIAFTVSLNLMKNQTPGSNTPLCLW